VTQCYLEEGTEGGVAGFVLCSNLRKTLVDIGGCKIKDKKSNEPSYCRGADPW